MPTFTQPGDNMGTSEIDRLEAYPTGMSRSLTRPAGIWCGENLLEDFDGQREDLAVADPSASRRRDDFL